MTARDALDTAGRIWGGARLLSARQTPAGWDIHLRPGHLAGSRVLASDMRDRWLSVHTLDTAGAVTCHDDCRKLSRPNAS